MGGGGDKRVTEYNPCANTWRNMQSLQKGRSGYSVCTLDNKIFVLGGGRDTTCEMLDLSDEYPQWRNIASMNSRHYGCGAVVIEKKIYVLGGYHSSVEVYDVDQGMMMEYLQREIGLKLWQQLLEFLLSLVLSQY